jgi:hypothetical protein
MKRLSIVAALVAIVVAVPLSIGSSHREAPLTSIDPTADDTDVYAYTAKDAQDSLTVVANWVPFEDPAGGPNFYKFDDEARYYINVDNTGDGVYDIRYRFDFTTKTRNEGTFLYGLGDKITSPRDKDLNVVQSYTVTRERYEGGRVASAKVLGERLLTPPNNVGEKTTPDYAATAKKAIEELDGGVKVFAGQRDDPFYASLGRIFDTVNLTGAGLGNKGGGVDDLAGYGVHSVVLQVPDKAVTRDGKAVESEKASNAVIGAWASTERRSLDVNGKGSGEWRQVSRLGNPLVNEVIIPLADKDKFNRTQPAADAKNFGKYVVTPGLAAALNALYPDVKAPEDNRTDIVQAVLQGVPGLNAFPGEAGKLPTDTLKINLGVQPSERPNRLGVLAKDLAGYPNGRRLTDDVADIDLQVVAGALKGNKVPLGDGVDANDKPFSNEFPYLADPGAGADPKAAYGSQLKGAVRPEQVAETKAPASGSTTQAEADDDDDGVGVGGWLAIAAGALVLAAAGFTLRRRRTHA